MMGRWSLGSVYIQEREDPQSPRMSPTNVFDVSCAAREHPIFEETARTRQKAFEVAERHLTELHPGKLAEVLGETKAKADDLEYRVKEIVDRLRSIGR